MTLTFAERMRVARATRGHERQTSDRQFRRWMRNGTLPPEACDECDEPACVTLTRDGRVMRACSAHLETLCCD